MPVESESPNSISRKNPNHNRRASLREGEFPEVPSVVDRYGFIARLWKVRKRISVSPMGERSDRHVRGKFRRSYDLSASRGNAFPSVAVGCIYWVFLCFGCDSALGANCIGKDRDTKPPWASKVFWASIIGNLLWIASMYMFALWTM